VRRAAQERQRTLQMWHHHLSLHEQGTVPCACELQPGRFRKGRRVGGCGKSRCYLCHGEKLLKQPTLQQRWANQALQERPHEW
jgi:hypothetical protein